MSTEIFPADHLQSFLTCLTNQYPADGNMYHEEAMSPFLPISTTIIENEHSDSSGCSDRSASSTAPNSPTENYGCDGYGSNRSQSPDMLKPNVTVPPPLAPENIEELLEEADLKRKRLARKAELARVSRKRKKMRIEELEAEVEGLKKDLERERKVRRRMADEQQKQRAVAVRTPVPVDDLNEALTTMINGSEGEAQQLLGDFYHAFKKAATSNKSALDQLKQKLSPCLPFQFVQWLLSQGDKFYADPSGLWQSLLATEVGASQEQLTRLSSLRHELKSDSGINAELAKAAAHLEALLRTRMEDDTKSMESFMAILSAPQLLSFFKWIDRFGEVCVKINL